MLIRAHGLQVFIENNYLGVCKYKYSYQKQSSVSLDTLGGFRLCSPLKTPLHESRVNRVLIRTWGISSSLLYMYFTTAPPLLTSFSFFPRIQLSFFSLYTSLRNHWSSSLPGVTERKSPLCLQLFVHDCTGKQRKSEFKRKGMLGRL